MARKLVVTLRRFAKNLALHTRSVITLKESLADAAKAIRSDSEKVRATVGDLSATSGKHRKAAKLAERGRNEYNQGRYSEAERYFRDAIIEDSHYVLPVTYLGHALYKQGKYGDAMGAWQRAYTLDPNSEEGQAAWRKMQGVKRKEKGAVSDLEIRQSASRRRDL